MEKDFVPYELAVKLKELGFDEECFGAYHNENYLDLESEEYDYSYAVKAPLFQQAFRWFREKGYRYTISFDSFMKNGMFYFEIWENGKCLFETDFDYNTYEEAELACLTKLIEIVESKSE